MAEIKVGKCENAECKYLETGVCEKGHENVDDCDSFSHIDSESNPLPDETPLQGETQNYTHNLYQFHNGHSLNLIDADSIASEAPTQLVILAGASASGKTTLLASIYEKFSDQEMGKYIFAGSKTLPGFEERCHLARIASERSTPDTERTKASEEMSLLHLKVAKEDALDIHTSILISDLSGEAFRGIRDSTEECKKMEILSKADHFALLVDGAQLSNKKFRQKALSDCRSLLRSCLDAEMLGSYTFVEIIFSKWDLISPNKEQNENTKFVDIIKNIILSEYSQSFGNLEFYEVASRPEKTSQYPYGYNLDIIFAEWVNKTPDKLSRFKESIQVENLTDGIDNYIA